MIWQANAAPTRLCSGLRGRGLSLGLLGVGNGKTREQAHEGQASFSHLAYSCSKAAGRDPARDRGVSSPYSMVRQGREA